MHAEITKLAQLITDYCVGVGKGDKVLIDGDPAGTSQLLISLHEEILKRGGIPFHKLTLGECDYLNLAYGQEFQFQSFAEDDKRIIENMDILIGVQGSMNPRRLERVDIEKLVKFSQATRIVREVTYKKYEAGKMKLLYIEFPTSAMAQEFGLPLVEYEKHFCRACFLDKPNPIQEWNRLLERQEELVGLLGTKKTISVKGEGLDLTFSINGKWTSDNGKRYLPDGEIFTDYIVKDSVSGSMTFTYPAIFQRRKIEDIELDFKDGEIVKVKSSTEEEFLQDLLSGNKEEEVYMSAFGIGTNYEIDKFIGHIAFDEKMGGTIHIALRSPLWVLLRRMGKDDQILADGGLVYENGNFII